jgi:hypothetical protein
MTPDEVKKALGVVSLPEDLFLLLRAVGEKRLRVRLLTTGQPIEGVIVTLTKAMITIAYDRYATGRQAEPHTVFVALSSVVAAEVIGSKA